MKNVYTNKELAHVWANEKQESARGSNMFFENGIIYSYGRHFPIAKIYHSRKEKGNTSEFKKLALFTNHGYSNTTSKHKGYVSQALNCTIIKVDEVDILESENPKNEKHAKNLDGILARVNDNIEKAKTARSRTSSFLAEAHFNINQFRRYVEFFRPHLQPNYKRVLKAMVTGEYVPLELKERAKLQDARAIELEKTREAREIEAQKEDLIAWINGEDKRRNFTETRLRIKNGYVETTKGARVTLQAAKVLYAKIKAGQDIKGYIIEGYTVISINGTLKIGCHEIPMSEVHRIGALLI